MRKVNHALSNTLTIHLLDSTSMKEQQKMSKKFFYLFFAVSVCLTLSFYTYFKLSDSSQIKILSFDGGGVRGTASLEILKIIQKDTGIDCHKHFDIFAGTSTGSIIAVLLACGMEIEELSIEYEKMSAHVFGNKIFGLFEPKYDPEPLKESLIQLLNSCGFNEYSLLKDIPKKVVIPTVCLNDPKLKRSSLQFRENISDKGGDIKIIDALMESTAAPLYFPSYKGYVDGGIGMKDPSLAALMCAYDPQKHNLNDFSVLSIGTGFQERVITGATDWGIAEWLVKLSKESNSVTPFITMLMDVGGQIPIQACSKLLGEAYIKVDFPLNENYPLDDYKDLDNLVSYTEYLIANNPKDWKSVCQWVESNVK